MPPLVRDSATPGTTRNTTIRWSSDLAERWPDDPEARRPTRQAGRTGRDRPGPTESAPVGRPLRREPPRAPRAMRAARPNRRGPGATLPATRDSSSHADIGGIARRVPTNRPSPSDRRWDAGQRQRRLANHAERRERIAQAERAPRRTGPPMRSASGPSNPVVGTSRTAGPDPPTVLVPRGWEAWDTLAVRVCNLPLHITTLDLWRTFHKEGRLMTIQLFEDVHGRNDGTAKLRFRPPPRQAFWQHGTYEVELYRAKTGARTFKVPVAVADTRPRPSVPSPIDPQIRFPGSMALHPLVVDFGFMFEKDTMMVMRSSEPRAGPHPVLELDLVRKQLDVKFELGIINPTDGGMAPVPPSAGPHPPRPIPTGAMKRRELYRFQIPLEQLQRMVEMEDAPDTRTLILSLDTPPAFYQRGTRKQIEASHDRTVPFWGDWSAWYRQTDIVYDRAALRRAGLSLRKAQPQIDIGRWTTYRFTVDNFGGNLATYRTLCSALKDYNVQITKVTDWKLLPAREPAIWDLIDRPANAASSSSSFLAEIQDASVAPLSFPVRYQLEVCLSQGQLNEHNLSKAFVEKLGEMEATSASDLLRHVAERRCRVYDPMSIFGLKVPRGARVPAKIPRYCALGRKATVTPSKIYFSTPMVETTNRVIRQYRGHADRFLRVQFSDEKPQGRINSTDKLTNDEVFSRIRRCLANGITVGDRRYEFLAFGNSQLREHGAYFFAPTLNLTVADIRSWMGDFSKIREVARYAARVGQCFSTTRAISGTKVQVVEMPDVKKGAFTFTDGVGKISESLAKLVAAELGLPGVPSVFQFRLGGCKGVLAVWPDARNWEIHIRPSQYKFAAVQNGLEIVRWSQFAAAALNRQLIIVLSALGVPDAVFVKKLRNMLITLERAMHDEQLAIALLRRQVDPNQTTLTMARLVDSGFLESREPFVMSLLHLWRSWTVKYLKERARIVIDHGAFVFGCTDETRTLKGHINRPERKVGSRDIGDLPEIFLQIPDDEDGGKYKVVEGRCLLARNPSLHPGDIRVVHAVDNPRLRHIKDAVVLPQTGDRDVASMCSGGDLDGDDFLVMWDEELIPPEWNHPPMDYTPPRPLTLDRRVTNTDITDFVVQYMKNDRLGRIATAHLALADRRELGVKDEKCLQLAALHSRAVDFVKSGQPAIMPRGLRPRIWPHFMESKYKTMYRSNKVLGQLFDLVERIDFVPRYESNFDSRILNAYEVSDSHMQSARELKEGYDSDMRRIMAQHEIKTEFEVWSTFALGHANMSKDYKFHEELGRIALALRDQYHGACIERAGGQQLSVLGPFVVAMYRVTRDEVAAALERQKSRKSEPATEGSPPLEDRPQLTPLISFPWCCVDVLCSIVNGHAKVVKLEDVRKVPAMMLFDEDLLGSTRKHGRHPKANVVESHALNGLDNTIETVEGPTRRGEVLELFNNGDGVGEVGGEEVIDRVTDEQVAEGAGRSDEGLALLSAKAILRESAPSSSGTMTGGSQLSVDEAISAMEDVQEVDQVREQQQVRLCPKDPHREYFEGSGDEEDSVILQGADSPKHGNELDESDLSLSPASSERKQQEDEDVSSNGLEEQEATSDQKSEIHELEDDEDVSQDDLEEHEAAFDQKSEIHELEDDEDVSQDGLEEHGAFSDQKSEIHEQEDDEDVSQDGLEEHGASSDQKSEYQDDELDSFVDAADGAKTDDENEGGTANQSWADEVEEFELASGGSDGQSIYGTASPTSSRGIGGSPYGKGNDG